MTPIDRFNDLQKQGFMKPRKVRKPKVEAPIVSCDACLNWHRKGTHTADKATRRNNLAALKAKRCSCAAGDPRLCVHCALSRAGS